MELDEEIIIPQVYLYTITWETNFGYQLETRGNRPILTNSPNGERPVTTNDNSDDVNENGVDFNTTRDSLDDVNDAAQSVSERLIDDISKNMTLLKLKEIKILIGWIRTFTTKILNTWIRFSGFARNAGFARKQEK